MSGLFAVLIVAFVYIGSSVTGGWNDKRNTLQSKNDAESNGRLTYNKYSKNGRIKNQIWAATGQKGYVSPVSGKFIDTRGRVVADIKQIKIDAANRYSINEAKKRGWDFYPYFRDLERNAYWSPYGYHNEVSWPCIDSNTGETISWMRVRGNEYRKRYVRIGNNGYCTFIRNGEMIVNQDYPNGFIREINTIAIKAWNLGTSIQ